MIRESTSIYIAIPTFRRTALLSKLLEALAGQRLSVDPSTVCVFVLDNDVARSAEATVSDFAGSFPFALRYEHVAEPGLTSVRNRSLTLANGGCDLLAMIDDDELPEPQWLDELLSAQRRTKSAVAVGPVPPILPDTAPRWLREFRARELPVYPDGTFLHDGWSGNCLLDMKAIRSLDVTFDSTLNFAGGEDQLFFRQIVARGGRIVYAARAIAWEDTPLVRQSLRFILLRSFRRGNTLALCDLRLQRRANAIASRGLKAIATMMRGAIKALVAVLRREPSCAVEGACDGMAALGMIARLAGITYQAYRQPKTSSASPC